MKKKLNTEEFKRAQIAAGLTAADLARRLECNISDIYRYMNGQSYPRPDRLKELIGLLGPGILGATELVNPLESLSRFTEREQQFLVSFFGLERHYQARVIGFCRAVYEYGQCVDANLAADLSEKLAKSQLPQEQLG